MKTLRIAHVLPSFQIGGQERVALDLARKQREAGHHVFAFAIDGSADCALESEFRAAGVETRALKKRSGVDPWLVVRLAARFATDRVDVVHTHNPLALTYAAPAGKLARAVVVHTKHGENPEVRQRRFLVRRAAAVFADVFVAVSPMTATAARASRDVHERKLRTIHNGIDLSRFDPRLGERDAVRFELQIPADAWVVGSVGRLASEKNHVLLVRALASVLGPDVRLVIVGDGPEAQPIRRVAAELGVTPWLHLPGARRDVPRLLQAFDVFALPSVSEGLPLVVLEAMATGLPVVASAVGGLPDVILDGETGALVAPGDAEALRRQLVALSSDPQLARAQGLRARDVAVAHYSLERMCQSYMELYQQLARAPERSALRQRGSPQL